MSGIRINGAAELLGVSPNTLRSWERRFGYPSPRRTDGGHRQYELADLEALRRALLETHNISSAIEVARRRGDGPTSPARLVEAFDRFDEHAADRAMEESLAMMSVERTMEELLLPALELAGERPSREPEHEAGCRWATGWLHAARRAAAPATRAESLLIFDSTESLTVEAVHVQALELALRRAGFKVLLLSIGLEPERAVRALRGTGPAAVLVAGGEASLDVVGRLVYAIRRAQPGAALFAYRGPTPVSGKHRVAYRGPTPVSGKHGVPSLGDGPGGAVAALRRALEEAAAARRDDVEFAAGFPLHGSPRLTA